MTAIGDEVAPGRPGVGDFAIVLGHNLGTWTGEGSPPSIEDDFDEAMSVPALLRHVRAAEAEGIAGVVAACFDYPGIGACRELASGPVIGIAEAAMKAATMLATSLSVVTTLPRWHC